MYLVSGNATPGSYNYHHVYVFVRGLEASGNAGFVVFFYQCKKTDNGEVIFYFESVGLVLYNIYYSVPQRNHYKRTLSSTELF